MKVANSSQQKIEVSMSTYGGGETKYYPFEKGHVGSWKRTDVRGYVMSVSVNGSTTPYYVKHEADIIIYDNRVTENGNTIRSANDNLV
ncbi:hypothetical protein PG911_02650 [Tenacibaculum ovolyticum]|uniref:hypothetical protein n=1 Tax=Tenacibaculum ovolyticum TaxID=104270 RepID=UPI0022F3C726|nr:hypothetical protein [Tenacibaculum ovolyticum]WBX77179.1 hypothetical protein PG911_02650 [Tenacibaculum ovolyticum]